MKVLLLFFAKKAVQFFNFLGRSKKGYKYDVVIVGNYDYMTVDQKLLVDRLNTENISNRFFFNVEKKTYFAKLIAYTKCAFSLGKAQNILVYDYCFPVFCMKKLTGQKIYQLWHANGAFKRVGLPNFREKYGKKMARKLYKLVPIHSNYDYIFVSNKICVPHYMEAFNDFNSEKFIVSNNIFLDLLIECSKKDPYVKKEKEINVILAKTFNYNPEENIYEQLVDRLYEEAQKRGLKANVTTLLHPKLAKNYDKINVMKSCDVLVTDYSSVCTEAAAIGKKVAFLRSKEKIEVFMDVAKKVYYDPKELAIDIMEDRLIDNGLTEQVTIDGDKQIDIVVRLIQKNLQIR